MNPSARQACLTAWKPSVNDDHVGAGHPCLVLYLPPNLGKPPVRHRTGKAVVFDHAGHVQIFDGDGVEFGGQPGSQFVRSVNSDVRDPLVQLGKLGFRFAPVCGAFHLAGA